MNGRFSALLLAAGVLATSTRARAGDPYLEWYTLSTPHFRVHYHGGLEDVAQRTATIAEDVQGRLAAQLGWESKELTQLVLTDDTDSANGSASALPYNTVRLFVTAPDDMSVLADYDDWMTELVTHEQTHVVHTDNKSGLVDLYNAIFGKRLAPNQTQPRWILEGLAVAMESEHTTAGRIRSSQFDMYLRADVLDHNLATLDQISHPARRWPSGNLWYLYGGRFVTWINEVYGPDTFAAVAADYGSNPIPWGINRSIRRATGHTYPELYAGFRAHLERRYAAQVRRIEERGRREGTQLTHRGRVVFSPRFVPGCARKGSREELLYYADDGHQTAGFYRVPLESRSRALEDETEIVTRAAGYTAGYDPACNLVFTSVAPSRRRYYFDDLFRLPRGRRSPRGLDGYRERLTTGRRARDPDVSPDGRSIVYVTNHSGTGTLRIARIDSEGAIRDERRLVPSARYEQAYTPRFSPDGRSVAYSVWTAGGHRDVRIVDVASERFTELSHDRALDQQPSWSPDGRFVFFASDRTGISNVYAYELSTGTLEQVTNVVTGAYMPELSADGKTLFYVGYTSRGFDLFSMPLDRARWLPAPAPTERPAIAAEPAAVAWPISSFNPLPTLRPHAFKIDYATGLGSFRGDAVTLSTSGADVIGRHSFAASLTLDRKEPAQPTASIDYAYSRLPFDLRMSGFRVAYPRKGYRYNDQEPVVTEYVTGITSGLSYVMPGEFDYQVVSLSYTASEYKAVLPVGPVADPYAQVTVDPPHGFLSSLRLGYTYSNAEASAYAVSTEKGFTLALASDYADPALGSDWTLTAFSGFLSAYVPLPWARHHVLALALSGAASTGTYVQRYATGGYLDSLPILDGFTSGVRQSAFVLRGYKPGQFIGKTYNLLNAEYRFPIAYVDHGVSTLPAFLRTVSGTFFADYGGAYNQLDFDDPLKAFHLGVGGELWLDVVLGYFVDGTIRLGLARGLDEQAPGWQKYAVVSSAF